MDQAAFTTLLQNALWQVVVLSAPVLVVTMVLGVLISILQAVTQVQESTLTFVPKILAAFLLIAVLSPWMAQSLVDYSSQLFKNLTEIALTK